MTTNTKPMTDWDPEHIATLNLDHLHPEHAKRLRDNPFRGLADAFLAAYNPDTAPAALAGIAINGPAVMAGGRWRYPDHPDVQLTRHIILNATNEQTLDLIEFAAAYTWMVELCEHRRHQLDTAG